MFCSVNDSACLEISVPGVGTDAIDLPAASKNISNAFSACSMVFSANSRSSAETSSFGSIMLSSSGLNGALPHFQNGVFALFAPDGFGITNLFRGIQRSSSGCTQTQGAASCLLLPLARRVSELDQGRGAASRWLGIIARRIGSAFRPGPSFAMSWGYFRPASHSEECSPRCFARASNSPDAVAWQPPLPALHPSP